ncbi:MAG: NUDIX domain-containing protein [Sphaerochaetaceae bacterium]|jgi:mutator protein MutT|nr:NUDIX domain-containing protein [Spirochaetaceae bacterium]MDY6344497.1 NUDIX domain-containing protein [Sphaerochaetaceae bacterium]
MEHRITTCGILRDQQGRYLVGLREKGGAIGGLWEFPGGKNRWGESVADTLKREWMEELGVSIDVGEELASHDFVNKETLYHLSAHAVSLPEGGQFRLSVHSKLAWVTKEEMAAMPFAPSDRAIIAQLAG